MPPRYIRASELGSFAFCRRAWFLEQQSQRTGLTQTREAGAAAGPEGARAARQTPTAARLSALLLVLGIVGITFVALMALTRP
jgi:hypothetical protein